MVRRYRRLRIEEQLGVNRSESRSIGEPLELLERRVEVHFSAVGCQSSAVSEDNGWGGDVLAESPRHGSESQTWIVPLTGRPLAAPKDTPG
jgi:hypothetical protein